MIEGDFCFYVFVSDVLMLGVGSAWSLSQLRSFFPEGRLINPSCEQLRRPCMGLQLLALLCSELAALPHNTRQHLHCYHINSYFFYL